MNDPFRERFKRVFDLTITRSLLSSSCDSHDYFRTTIRIICLDSNMFFHANRFIILKCSLRSTLFFNSELSLSLSPHLSILFQRIYTYLRLVTHTQRGRPLLFLERRDVE